MLVCIGAVNSKMGGVAKDLMKDEGEDFNGYNARVNALNDQLTRLNVQTTVLNDQLTRLNVQTNALNAQLKRATGQTTVLNA